jgi:GNAT superfamily N-acetyltransferase
LSQKFENIREAKKTDIPELVKAIKDGYESAKLYLKKKFQKQGIGTVLLKYLIYHLHDNSELRVFAYSCNKAISFYEKFGFEHQVKLLGKYPFAPGLMAKTRGYSLNSSQIIKIKNCINKQLSSPKVAQGQEG